MVIEVFDEVEREDVKVGSLFDLEDGVNRYWTVIEVTEEGVRLEASESDAKISFSWEEMGF